MGLMEVKPVEKRERPKTIKRRVRLMARKKDTDIEEAARKLAGNKNDDRFTDPVEGLIAKEKRDLEKRTERVKRSYLK